MKYNKLITIALILSLNCTQLLAINYTNTSIHTNTSTQHEHTDPIILKDNTNIHEKLIWTHETLPTTISTNIKKHNNNFNNFNNHTLITQNIYTIPRNFKNKTLNNTKYIIDESGNIGCISKYYRNNSTHNSISTNNTQIPMPQTQNSNLWQLFHNYYDKFYEKTQFIRNFLYQQCIELLIASLLLAFADSITLGANVPMILIPGEIFDIAFNIDAIRYLPVDYYRHLYEHIQPRYDICPLFLYPVHLSPRTLEYLKECFPHIITLITNTNAFTIYPYLWLFNKTEFNKINHKNQLIIEIIQLTLRISKTIYHIIYP